MTRNDTRIIHTDGLEEGIRCAMCTNPMANNRGCDGGCDINESMYKRVLDVIKKNILEQEPCEDCISRQAVIDILDDMTKDYAKSNDFEKVNGVAWVKVQKLPPINPQKIGHWKEHRNRATGHIETVCSECGAEEGYPYNDYCGNCGAQMFDPQESEE